MPALNKKAGATPALRTEHYTRVSVPKNYGKVKQKFGELLEIVQEKGEGVESARSGCRFEVFYGEAGIQSDYGPADEREAAMDRIDDSRGRLGAGAVHSGRAREPYRRVSIFVVLVR